MSEENKNVNGTYLSSDFRIKTLEELNQNQSMYEGMITYFREDGKIPEPMKSVEELNRVHKSAPIYYGRKGEKYGTTAELTEKARESLKLDNNAVIPEDYETVETKETKYSGSATSGLDTDYLSSLLEEDGNEFELNDIKSSTEKKEVSTDAMNDEFSDESDMVAGLSEDQLRIQRAIFGDEFDIVPEPKKETIKKPIESSLSQATNVTKPIDSATTTSPIHKTSKLSLRDAGTGNAVPLTRHVQPSTNGNTFVVSNSNNSGSNNTVRNGMAGNSFSSANESGSSTSGLTLSRAEFLKRSAAETSPLTPSKNSDDAVIVNEKKVITATDVVKEIMLYAICVLVALGLSIFIVKYVGQKTEVSGDSMNNTLYNADQLIVDKVTYRSHDPKRFDLVVFPESPTSNYVKRIIGLPGETVTVEEGYIYIDGQLLADDTYGKEPIDKEHYYRLQDGVTLGEGEYFVLGDNRNNSKDSRDPEVGNVVKDRIIGKVVFRIWPLKHFGKVE